MKINSPTQNKLAKLHCRLGFYLRLVKIDAFYHGSTPNLRATIFNQLTQYIL